MPQVAGLLVFGMFEERLLEEGPMRVGVRISKNEGSCRWKLSSGNLYTFVRPG